MHLYCFIFLKNPNKPANDHRLSRANYGTKEKKGLWSRHPETSSQLRESKARSLDKRMALAFLPMTTTCQCHHSRRHIKQPRGYQPSKGAFKGYLQRQKPFTRCELAPFRPGFYTWKQEREREKALKSQPGPGSSCECQWGRLGMIKT